MTKRLKKSEFILTYMIIITLACFVGGFFLGAGYMKGKIHSEQVAATEAVKEQAKKEQLLKEQKLYKEQDFVRFYYGVYAPALEVKNAHFNTLENLSGKSEKEQLSLLKELIDLAENKLQAVEKDIALATSPLLAQAQSGYAQSLRTYLDGIEQIVSAKNSNAMSPETIQAQLTLFTNSWLKAQSDLYKSIAIWESAYVTKRSLPKELPSNVTAVQWNTFPFHYRTYIAAEYLASLRLFQAFNPEDLTARLDLLLKSNEAKTLGIKDVPAAIRVLQATDAVRVGDFKNNRVKLYTDLRVPEMPMYTE